MGKKLNKYWLICIYLALALTTLAVFWQVRDHDFLNYDDNVYVTDNPNIQSGFTFESTWRAFTTPVARNWHPVTCLSLMLDYQLFGLSPAAFHMTNMFLHMASTLLLFWVLNKMTSRTWPSAFVAAAFAMHPLHVESVAWVAERKDVLSTFFWILTMVAYLRYARHPDFKKSLPVLFVFILGLLSKPMLVTLPFVLLLLDYWPLGRVQLKKSNRGPRSCKPHVPPTVYRRSTFAGIVKEKIPFFILSAVFSGITILTQHQAGTMRSLEMIPIPIRIANALISYAQYIQKMIIPTRLAVLYPHPGDKLALSYAIPATLLLLVFSIIVIRNLRQRPYLAVGWLWYLGTLVPVIGLVQVGAQAMADRYTYIPLTGLFIIIAWAVPDLLSRWRYRNIALAFTAPLILATLAVTTWTQLHHWKNSITLFEHAINVTHNNHLAHNNLATALDDNGKSEAAIPHYLKALQIKPDYARARYNLGNAYMHLGKLDEAITHWTAVLYLEPDNTDARNNIGAALTRLGRFKQAAKHYRHILRIKPYNITAKNNLAKALKNQQQLQQTLNAYKRANELANQHKFAEAIDLYLQALRIRPKFVAAHNNLGNAYFMQADFDKALTHYSKAIEIDPNFAEAHYNLGALYHQQGKNSEAFAEYYKTLKLDPNHPKAQQAIGRLFMKRK